jgi:glycerate kinase
VREVAWGLVQRGDTPTAVMEAAQVVGITDPAAMRVPVARRSTLGIGELMRHALDQGIRHFMIGLGGSSTNDGGAGLLVGLGVQLLDAADAPIAPTPTGLASIARVDASALDARLRSSSITIMSDVDNPLCGDRGATAIFGPQKGVRANEIASFDAAIARFAELAERAMNVEVAQHPGAGAAGGLGFALQLLGGRFASGAEVVADLIELDAALASADWAITGEGRSDRQTLLGKAPWIVAKRAARYRVPISLLSGAVDPAALPELAPRFAGCFALPSGPMSLEACVASAADLLADRAEQMARLRDATQSRSKDRSG